MRRLFLAFGILLAGFAGADAQSMQPVPYSYLSSATTNPTLVYAGPSLLKDVIVVNTTATVYYLKLYNKATAPTCGTDTPVWRIPIPNNTQGGGFVALSTDDVRFPLGLGFCLTGGLADSDTTVAATGVAINLATAWQ